MQPLPEPSAHPLEASTLETRYVRALFLATLCADYAESLQVLVSDVLSLEDPYRGGNGKALLAITAAREVIRTALAVIKTSSMDEFFASELRNEISAFQERHPHLKNARDIVAHVDEYMESKGRIKDQWFDIRNDFKEGSWTLRIGKNLDIDMVEIAAEAVALAESAKTVTLTALYIESKLEPASRLVEGLLAMGVSAELSVDADSGVVTIHSLRSESKNPGSS